MTCAVETGVYIAARMVCWGTVAAAPSDQALIDDVRDGRRHFSHWLFRFPSLPSAKRSNETSRRRSDETSAAAPLRARYTHHRRCRRRAGSFDSLEPGHNYIGHNYVAPSTRSSRACGRGPPHTTATRRADSQRPWRRCSSRAGDIGSISASPTT